MTMDDDKNYTAAQVDLKLARWRRKFLIRDPDTFFHSQSARERYSAMKRRMLAEENERAYEERHKRK